QVGQAAGASLSGLPSHLPSPQPSFNPPRNPPSALDFAPLSPDTSRARSNATIPGSADPRAIKFRGRVASRGLQGNRFARMKVQARGRPSSSDHASRRKVARFAMLAPLVVTSLAAGLALAQTAAPSGGTAEIRTQETPPTFKLQVERNLV